MANAQQDQNNDQISPADIIQSIANEIQALARGISGEHQDMLTAKNVFQGKSGDLVNKRMILCTEIARLADEQDWKDEHIKVAADKAKAMIMSGNNDPSLAETSKAMQVFVSQIKLPAHESVRGQFETVRDVIHDAWLTEQENLAADKKAKVTPRPTPIKNFVSREYELVLRACREVIDPAAYGHNISDASDRLIIRSAQDVRDWAELNDPDKDPDKAEAKLATLAKSLNEISKIFGLQEVTDAYAKIAGVKSSSLRQARQAKLKSQHKPASAPAKAVSTPVAAPKAVSTPVVTTPEPAPDTNASASAGVFDPMAQEVLNEPAPAPQPATTTTTQPSPQLQSVIEALMKDAA